jgi:hypothetical protein
MYGDRHCNRTDALGLNLINSHRTVALLAEAWPQIPAFTGPSSAAVTGFSGVSMNHARNPHGAEAPPLRQDTTERDSTGLEPKWLRALPEPICGRLWPETQCKRSKIRSQTARASGPENCDRFFFPFALRFRTKPAPNRPRQLGPWTGSAIEQPKVGSRRTHHVYKLSTSLLRRSHG